MWLPSVAPVHRKAKVRSRLFRPRPRCAPHYLSVTQRGHTA